MWINSVRINSVRINSVRINIVRIKSVRVRSYFGPHFPALGLNAERYGVSLRILPECGKMIRRDERYGISLRIQSESGKMRTRIPPNADVFHAVWCASLRLLFKTLLWVVFYPQQWHIGINENYWHVILISKHILLLYIFWCRSLNNFYKHLKPSFFSNAVKTKNLHGIRIWEILKD